MRRGSGEAWSFRATLRRAATTVVAGALIVAPTHAIAAHRITRRPATPVVVELYTAQGCSACPQANALLQELSGKRGVIALSFPVDLWDYLGWSDTLARPEFSARQRAYVARFKLREIYTPEIVIDGRREALGFDREKVQALIDNARAARPAKPRPAVHVNISAGRVTIGAAERAESADVWLVRYDPSEQTVKVKAGENKGKTVIEQDVVRTLVRLGGWSGPARTYHLPAPEADGLSTLVLVQGVRGGPVIATAPDERETPGTRS